MISSFTGTITKVQINGIQVFPGTQKITLEPGRTMVIQVDCQITPYGDIGVLDYWTSAVTAKLETQFGWDMTTHRGSGLKTATPQIGNLKSPTAPSTLVIKLYAIDAVNPTAPRG